MYPKSIQTKGAVIIMFSIIISIIGWSIGPLLVGFCLLCIIAANGKTQVTTTYRYVNCTEEEYNEYIRTKNQRTVERPAYSRAG